MMWTISIMAKEEALSFLLRHGLNNDISNNIPWRTMPNPVKSKCTPRRTSWRQSHLQGREEQLHFTHISPSARWAQPSTKEIACAYRVPHGRREWFWSLDPTFSPLRAPSVGWFSILPHAQYDRQRAIPRDSEKQRKMQDVSFAASPALWT